MTYFPWISPYKCTLQSNKYFLSILMEYILRPMHSVCPDTQGGKKKKIKNQPMMPEY